MAADVKVDKQLLAKLRKESGSPFSKCHSALARCSNDFEKALSWLEEQSRKEGWKKAEKMKGRLASEGLVSAVVEDNIAALVEVRYHFILNSSHYFVLDLRNMVCFLLVYDRLESVCVLCKQ